MEKYRITVECFRSGQIPIKDFVRMLHEDSDLSIYYRALLEKEVGAAGEEGVNDG